MNIYHRRLKLFMQLKGDKIKEITGIDFYCSDKAIESIEDAEKVYYLLCHQIAIKQKGISGHICPFCLYINLKGDVGCVSCGWAKENGICQCTKNNTYTKVTNLKKYDIETWNKLISKLNTRFYKSIIKKCNEIN